MLAIRVSLIFTALFLNPSSCARLKKSSTQRKLADSTLVSAGAFSSHVEFGPVSDALKVEKDKFAQLIQQEEDLVNRYSLDLSVARSDRDRLKREVSEKKGWWKFWNLFNPWKSEIQNLENRIGALGQRIASLETDINKSQQHIKHLENAKGITHDAHEKAKEKENHIAFVNAQLESTQQRHVSMLAANEESQKRARELNDDKIRRMDEELATLRNDLKELQNELEALKKGEHALHTQWNEVKTPLQGTIASHQTKINNLTALIGDNDRRIEEVKNERAQAREVYEKSLAEVRADRESLVHQRRELSDQMDRHIAELAQVTAEGEAKIEDMKKMLEQQIQELVHDIQEQQDRIKEAISASAARISTLKAEQNAVIERLDEEIETHQIAKTSAVEALDELKKAHDTAVSGDVALSEALQKAKFGLEVELAATARARRDTADDVAREQAHRHRLHDDKRRKSRWWCWAWYKITGELDRLDREISNSGNRINALSARGNREQEQIRQLKERISSKMNAAEVAADEEESIRAHESNIQEMQSDKVNKLKKQELERGMAKEEGESEVKELRKGASDLEEEEAKARDVLADLNDANSGHTVHVELQQEKDQIQNAIDARNASIARFNKTIISKQSLEEQIKQDEENDLADHAITLTDLQEHSSTMANHKASEEQAKSRVSDQLQKLETEHGELVATEIGALEAAIPDLKQAISDSEQDIKDEKLDDVEYMRELKKKQFRDATAVSEEIQLLEAQKAESHVHLDTIQAQHLS